MVKLEQPILCYPSSEWMCSISIFDKALTDRKVVRHPIQKSWRSGEDVQEFFVFSIFSNQVGSDSGDDSSKEETIAC